MSHGLRFRYLLRTSLFLLVSLLVLPAAGPSPSGLYHRAINGEADAVEEYLGNRKNLSRGDDSGRRLVHWLARFGYEEGVRAWLEAGGEIDPLIDRRKVAGSRGKDLLDRSRLGGATPLFVAASAGRSRIVAVLLEAGADTNARAEDGSTPLIAAARNGCLLCARSLLEAGAGVEDRDAEGVTPLLAVGQGPVGVPALRSLLQEWELDWFHTLDYSMERAELLRLLLEREADLEARTAEGERLLHLAARGGYEGAIDAALAAGVAPDEPAAAGRTPALLAAIFDHVEVVDRLVEAGAQPVVVDELVRDIHGMAVLHERIARRRESQGDREGAYQAFDVAASRFYHASREFERIARERRKKIARKEIRDAYLNALLEASLSASSQLQAKETAKIAALRDAVGSGSGLSGYYAALDERYREIAALPWDQATAANLGNLSLNQRLPDADWVPILASRSMLAAHAAGRIRDHMRTAYADLERFAGDDPVRRFLLRTRCAWLDGALGEHSPAYREDAFRPREVFLETYLDELGPTLERALEMQAPEEDEYLASYRADEFIFTSRRLYVLAGTPRVISLESMVRYRVKISAMDLMIELDTGEKILFPELKRFPEPELVELLNPDVNRKGK
jgi:ankyrin repeat protein